MPRFFLLLLFFCHARATPPADQSWCSLKYKFKDVENLISDYLRSIYCLYPDSFILFQQRFASAFSTFLTTDEPFLTLYLGCDVAHVRTNSAEFFHPRKIIHWVWQKKENLITVSIQQLLPSQNTSNPIVEQGKSQPVLCLEPPNQIIFEKEPIENYLREYLADIKIFFANYININFTLGFQNLWRLKPEMTDTSTLQEYLSQIKSVIIKLEHHQLDSFIIEMKACDTKLNFQATYAFSLAIHNNTMIVHYCHCASRNRLSRLQSCVTENLETDKKFVLNTGNLREFLVDWKRLCPHFAKTFCDLSGKQNFTFQIRENSKEFYPLVQPEIEHTIVEKFE